MEWESQVKQLTIDLLKMSLGRKEIILLIQCQILAFTTSHASPLPPLSLTILANHNVEQKQRWITTNKHDTKPQSLT